MEILREILHPSTVSEAIVSSIIALVILLIGHQLLQWATVLLFNISYAIQIRKARKKHNEK